MTFVGAGDLLPGSVGDSWLSKTGVALNEEGKQRRG